MSQVIQDPLFAYSIKKETERKPPIQEPIILALTLVLIGFSLVMVYSTTGVVSHEKFGDAYFYVKRQAMAAMLGLVAMFGISRIPLDWIRKASPYLFGACLVLLAGTLIPGLGDRAGGAHRWLNLGFVRFQPGEFVKLLFVIYLAGYLARHEVALTSFITGIVKPLMLVGLVCALYLKQPDFGSSVILCAITIIMIASSGARIRHLVCMFLAFVIPGILLVALSPYRMRRVTSFLSPWSDPSGSGYQLIQSLIAIGSGKATGVGLGASQQKLFFLPAAHTDFIFAVIAEELGMLGCMGLLAVFLFFLARGMKLAARVVEDTFAFALVIGITSLIVIPALLNTGVVTGLLPTKGMVLPLVGYGGSSVMACLMGVGILLCVARWNLSRR